MLISLDKETGERVFAEDAIKGREYICPSCESPLILKQGEHNIWHFAHKEDNICIFRRGGEGANHDLMKKVVKDLLDKQNPNFESELEYCFDNGRIADICYKNKRDTIAIECVDKHTDLKDFKNKLESYRRSNIKSMWIFDLKKFLNKKGQFKEEIRTTEFMRRCHKMNYAKIWAVDTKNKVMYAIHFDKVYRTRSYFDEENYEYDYYDVALKSTKEIKYSLQKNLKFYMNNKSIVGPFCEPFWKMKTLEESEISIEYCHKGLLGLDTPKGYVEEPNCDCIGSVYNMLQKAGYSEKEIYYFDKDLRKRLKEEWDRSSQAFSKCFKCKHNKKSKPSIKWEEGVISTNCYKTIGIWDPSVKCGIL